MHEERGIGQVLSTVEVMPSSPPTPHPPTKHGTTTGAWQDYNMQSGAAQLYSVMFASQQSFVQLHSMSFPAATCTVEQTTRASKHYKPCGYLCAACHAEAASKQSMGSAWLRMQTDIMYSCRQPVSIPRMRTSMFVLSVNSRRTL